MPSYIIQKEHDNEDKMGKEGIAFNASFTNVSETIEESHLDSKLIICPAPLDGPIDWGLVGKGIALSMGQGTFKLYPKCHIRNCLCYIQSMHLK